MCYHKRMRLAITLAFSAFYLLVFSPHSHAAKVSVLDAAKTYSSDISRFEKWNKVVERDREQAELSESSCGDEQFHPCHVLAWSGRLKEWGRLEFFARLSAVNTYANAHPYVTDMVNWGVPDFWETPYEFMVKNGDCEDYAIAKYISLRLAGVRTDQLRVIIVQDMNLGGVMHAILGVYDDNNTLYILDNQIKQVVKASSIYHYKPIYGINEHGWWAYLPKTIRG